MGTNRSTMSIPKIFFDQPSIMSKALSIWLNMILGIILGSTLTAFLVKFGFYQEEAILLSLGPVITITILNIFLLHKCNYNIRLLFHNRKSKQDHNHSRLISKYKRQHQVEPQKIIGKLQSPDAEKSPPSQPRGLPICIIGTGVKGLVMGACFADFGLNVTFTDNDNQRLTRIKAGEISFHEPGLFDLINKGISTGKLVFTNNLNEAIDTGFIIFPTVGTTGFGADSINISYIEELANRIGQEINSYKIIVTNSNTPFGMTQRIKSLIEKSQRTLCKFDVCSNPELIREGSAIQDFMMPDRVVIGADSEQATALMKDLYRPLYLIETPIIVTDIPTAELINYVSNAFVATKISFVNEMANLCERININVQTVTKGLGMDKQIGRKFLQAGPGYSGTQIEKDTKELIQIGMNVGYKMEIATSALEINKEQIGHMIDRIQVAVGDLKGKTIGFLGLSTPPSLIDETELSALMIAEKLLDQGCTLRATAPPEGIRTRGNRSGNIIVCKNAYDAATGSDALILATNQNQVRNLDFFQIETLLRQPILIDFRNVYEPNTLPHRFKYVSVGRQPVGPP